MEISKKGLKVGLIIIYLSFCNNLYYEILHKSVYIQDSLTCFFSILSFGLKKKNTPNFI